MRVGAINIEHIIVAPKDGIVGETYFKLGCLVDPNTELLELQNVQESQELIEKDT